MLIVANQTLTDIPCLIMQDDRFTQTPLILHYHGWTGHKGDANTPDQTLMQAASAGFTIVAPDCVEHGERRSDAWFRAMFNGWAFICDAMDRTRQEAPSLLDAALALPAVSSQNPQVTGVSMGGLIAQMVFAQDERFASLISVIGRSSFYQADEWCRQAQAGTWCDEWCAKYATQSHPERFVDRPLLFMDGGQDTDCPAAVNSETIRLINEAGGQAQHFVDEAVGHQFSPDMRERYIDWVAEHKG
ncbi:MAG: prolyl oligopeptidase family serine peptidase [Chloroflexota bacterium]